MKPQGKAPKRIPLSDFTLKCVGTLLKRLVILLLLCSLFIAAALYIPEKVTYEQIPKGSTLSGSIQQQSNPVYEGTVDDAQNSSAFSDDVMILRLCEDDGGVCVFAGDGTKKGVVKLSESAVTHRDLSLLQNGIVLTRDELYELLCQLEAELFADDNVTY